MAMVALGSYASGEGMRPKGPAADGNVPRELGSSRACARATRDFRSSFDAKVLQRDVVVARRPERRHLNGELRNAQYYEMRADFFATLSVLLARRLERHHLHDPRSRAGEWRGRAIAANAGDDSVFGDVAVW